MLITKRIIGWLCLLSLAATIFGVSYWVYFTASPFLRGAVVYRLNEPNPGEIIHSVAANGLRQVDTDALKKYVTQPAPKTTYTLWDVSEPRVFELVVSGDKERDNADLPATSAAVLFDTQGKVVATYPETLQDRLSPVPAERMQELNARQWYNGESVDGNFLSYENADISMEWGEAIFKEGLAPDYYAAMQVYPIKTSKDKPIGYLATFSAPDRWITYMPNSAKMTGYHVSRWTALVLGGISLLVYLITLPIWVAMDAGWRGMRPFPWAALTVVTGLIGFLAYMISRLSPPGPCPNCGEQVLVKFKRCPACGTSLVGHCPTCKTKMKAGWQYCPVCSEAPPEPTEPAEPSAPSGPIHVEAAPTWTAPEEPALPSPRANATLAIAVSDANSGAPIPNAGIAIAGPVTIDGLTNRTGTFQAHKLRTGTYTITATHPGYQLEHAQITVDDELSQSIRLTLTALPAAINGRIMDRKSLHPIAGAQVYIDSTRVDRSATTSGDGTYALENIPAGPYTIEAQAEGFVSQTKLVETTPGSRIIADLALDVDPETARHNMESIL